MVIAFTHIIRGCHKATTMGADATAVAPFTNMV